MQDDGGNKKWKKNHKKYSQVIDFIEYLKLSHLDQKAPDSVTIKNKKDLKENLQKGLEDINNNKVYSVDEVFTNLDNI